MTSTLSLCSLLYITDYCPRKTCAPSVNSMLCGFREVSRFVKTTRIHLKAHSPVMCEIEISNCRKINLIIAYCFIFVLREEHLENAFA